MSKLYIVGTPIGNLKDITLRALHVLEEVDLILCEDTRVTRKLLSRYNIKTPTQSYHQHSKLRKLNYILNLLKQGKNLALVSDRGTPDIDDPGGVIVAKAAEEEVKIVPIPGTSAVSVALSVCGFLAQRFLFLGFLPKKKGRKTMLSNILISAEKIKADVAVLFESPYRIIKTLTDLKTHLGDKRVAVCRELTKKFEEIYRGDLSSAIKHYQKSKPKGEFTVCIKLK